MFKKNVMIVVIFLLLKGLAANTSANESINPFLVYYGGGSKLTTESLSAVAEYDLLVVGRHRFNQVNGNTWSALKALSPDIKIFLYQLGAEVADNTDSYAIRALNNLGRYNVSRGSSQGSINLDHPDWFLKNRAGERIRNLRNRNVFQLDFGNPAFADYWAAHTLDDITFQEWRADGVFMDEVAMCSDTFLREKPNQVPAKYADCGSWNNSMSDFLVRVTGALNKHSQEVMANVGNSFNSSTPNAWQDLGQRDSAPDVLVEEGAFAAAWGAKGVVLHWPVKNWLQQINLPSTVRSHIAMISHTDLAPGQQGVSWAGEPVTHSQIKRFAIGSYLLARNGSGPTTYFLFDDDRKVRGSSYDRLLSAKIYDEFDIGAPVASYEKKLVDQDLYFRKYTKGYAYVNPGDTTIVSIKAESDAEFGAELNNARREGADWYFDLPPHDAAIVKANATTSVSKQGTPPKPPLLHE